MSATTMHRYEDKVAIVTGAAHGIGLATACALASEGARIVLADHDSSSAIEAQRHVTEAGAPEVSVAACDVSIEADVARCVDDALQRYKRLDLIVNNAGLMTFKALVQLERSDWERIFAVDLFGAFHFIKCGLKGMHPGAAIVNVSSIHALRTEPLVAPYAAAKAALVSLTRSAAIEAKPLGIRVNAILPGAVDTRMLWDNPNVRSGAEHVDPAYVGTADQVAASIAFLGSDAAAFIHGASLVVDGGRLDRL